MPSDAKPSTPGRTLAIFGATGRTGSETLKALLAKPTNPFSHMKIFVRSREKLIKTFPQLKTDNSVEIIEGQVTDETRIKACLVGADTIICALGENDNKPTVRVLQDSTTTIVSALKQLKKEGGTDWKKPWFILLSSSTWNERFAAKQPWLVMWMIKNAFYWPYADLRKAHENLQAEPDLLLLLLVQPPAIIDEEASGYTISTESVGLACSYPDLGAAFAELATEEAYRETSAVGVTSTMAKAGFSRYGPEILPRVIFGLMASFIPGAWRVVPSV